MYAFTLLIAKKTRFSADPYFRVVADVYFMWVAADPCVVADY